MLITYCLTVRLLARQQQSLCGGGSGSGGGGLGGGSSAGGNGTTSTAGGVSTTNGNQPNGWGSGWLGQQTNLGKLSFIGTVPFFLQQSEKKLQGRKNQCATFTTFICVFTFILITFIISIWHTDRRCTWRRLLKTSLPSTPNHPHSANSTDTELSNLDTHELWLPDSR